MIERVDKDGVTRVLIQGWVEQRTVDRVDAIAARHRGWKRRDVIEEAVALLYDAEFPALVSDEEQVA